MAQLVERVGFGGRAAEVGEAEGFEQVVDGIELEALHGVLGVGRGEDHHRADDHRADEVHARKVGHVDVGEDQIDRVRGEELLRVDGVGEGRRQFQIGDLGDVACKLAQGQRFVVDGDTFKHGVRELRVSRCRFPHLRGCRAYSCARRRSGRGVCGRSPVRCPARGGCAPVRGGCWRWC